MVERASAVPVTEDSLQLGFLFAVRLGSRTKVQIRHAIPLQWAVNVASGHLGCRVLGLSNHAFSVSTRLRIGASIAGMDREREPRDLTTAARVALVLAELHECEEADRDQLLTAFLRAEWPTERAQSQ
jgi:hypothetical protein